MGYIDYFSIRFLLRQLLNTCIWTHVRLSVELSSVILSLSKTKFSRRLKYDAKQTEANRNCVINPQIYNLKLINSR